MGPVMQEHGQSLFQRLSSLLSTAISGDNRVPSCSRQIQEMGAKVGSHCSKHCPGSIHHHLALPGGWTVKVCS